MALALNVFSTGADRFCPQGYRETMRLQERISAASKLKGIDAVELDQTDITPELPSKDLKRMLKDYNLACSAVSANSAVMATKVGATALS